MSASKRTCGSWLQALLKRLQDDTGIYGAADEAPNHVLMNAYLPGQGILPHQVHGGPDVLSNLFVPCIIESG